MPEEEQASQIVRELYQKLESLAIWVPFEEVLREDLEKLPRYEKRIQENGIPEDIMNPNPKKISIKNKVKRPKCGRDKRKKENNAEFEDSWQDNNFYFIAGYTSGGAPYGMKYL